MCHANTRGGTGCGCILLGGQRPSPYKVQLSVAGKPLEMKVDKGASLSVISEEQYDYLFSSGQALQLVETGIVLRTYTGEEVKTWSLVL